MSFIHSSSSSDDDEERVKPLKVPKVQLVRKDTGFGHESDEEFEFENLHTDRERMETDRAFTIPDREAPEVKLQTPRSSSSGGSKLALNASTASQRQFDDLLQQERHNCMFGIYLKFVFHPKFTLYKALWTCFTLDLLSILYSVLYFIPVTLNGLTATVYERLSLCMLQIALQLVESCLLQRMML